MLYVSSNVSYFTTESLSIVRPAKREMLYTKNVHPLSPLYFTSKCISGKIFLIGSNMLCFSILCCVFNFNGSLNISTKHPIRPTRNESSFINARSVAFDRVNMAIERLSVFRSGFLHFCGLTYIMLPHY